MKMTRFRKIRYGSSLLLIVLVLFIPVAAQAGISVRDTWTTSGRLDLRNADWSATFRKEEGALSVYSKMKETVKIVPFYSEKAQTILSCKVVEDKGDQVWVRASFSAGEDQIEGDFLFDREGAIQVRPSQNMKGILIFGEISFGIVPAPPLEDLIYDPKEYPAASYLYLPSESLFVGLLKGEDRLFFCAWPDGNQRVKLLLEDGGEDEKLIEAFEIQLDGKSAYLRSISAPGIWHREEFLPIHMEKDIEIDWKRPSSAKWKTQLLEGEIETAFHFRDKRVRTWRPNFGFYEYPVWFEEGKAFFHFSKKVPPPGQVLIYSLEGHRDTPLEFAKARLGSISTLSPRTGFRHYPPDNVGIQHCDGRAWVKWIFKLGRQAREKEFLQAAMDDFLYSISVEKVRLEEYEGFIPRMKDKVDLWIEEEKDAVRTGLKPAPTLFFNQMKERVEELEREYWDKMDNSPASEHLREETEVINKLKVLIEEEGLEVYPEACYLLDKIQLWSLMESVPGGVGGSFREMFQQAGYGCAHDTGVIKYAEEIRRDVREFLLTGETYEAIYPQLWD